MFGRSPIAQKAVKSVSEKTIEQAIRATIQCPDFPPVATALFTPVAFATRRSPPRSRTPSPVPQTAKVSSAPPSLPASPSAAYLEIAVTPRDVPLTHAESFEAPLPMTSFALDEPEMMVTLGQVADGSSSAPTASAAPCVLPEPAAVNTMSIIAAIPMDSVPEAAAMNITPAAAGAIGLEVELPTSPSSALLDAPVVCVAAEYAPISPAQLPLLDARVVEAILGTASKELPAAIDTVSLMGIGESSLATPVCMGNASSISSTIAEPEAEPAVVFRNIF